MSEINNSPILGKIGNIEIKNTDEKLLHAYHLDEGAGDVAYDSVKEWTTEKYQSDWSSGTNGWVVAIDGGTDSTRSASNNNLIINVATGGRPNRPAVSRSGIYESEQKTKITIIAESGKLTGYYSGGNYHPLSTPHDFSLIPKLEIDFTTDGIDFIMYFNTLDGSQQIVINSILFEEVHQPSHSTINNGDETLFVTDNRFDSKQNDVGWMGNYPCFKGGINSYTYGADKYNPIWEVGIATEFKLGFWMKFSSDEPLIAYSRSIFQLASSNGFYVTHGSDGNYLTLRITGSLATLTMNVDITADNNLHYVEYYYDFSTFTCTMSIDGELRETSDVVNVGQIGTTSTTGEFRLGKGSLARKYASELYGLSISGTTNNSNVFFSLMGHPYGFTSSNVVSPDSVALTSMFNGTQHTMSRNEAYNVIANGNIVPEDPFNRGYDVLGDVIVTYKGTGVAPYVTAPFYPIALDEDGNSTHLTVFGNVPTMDGRTKNNVKVVGNSCLEFDGETGYTNVNESIVLNFNEAWKIKFRLNPTLTENYHIMSNNEANASARIAVINDGFLIIDTDTDVDVTSTLVINNDWDIITIESDGVGNIAFSNATDSGVVTASTALSFTINNFGSPRGFTTSLPFFKGLIDYVTITTPNKTYTYNFGEGAGDIVYDRTEVAIGSELITNGDFADGLVGWEVNGTGGTIEVVTYEGIEQCHLVKDTADVFIRQSVMTVGKTYIIEFDAIKIAGTCFYYDGTLTGITTGHNVIERTTGITTPIFQASNNGEFYITNITTKLMSNPINGTLQNGCDWVTDPQASPSNLMEGFSGAISSNGTTDYIVTDLIFNGDILDDDDVLRIEFYGNFIRTLGNDYISGATSGSPYNRVIYLYDHTTGKLTNSIGLGDPSVSSHNTVDVSSLSALTSVVITVDGSASKQSMLVNDSLYNEVDFLGNFSENVETVGMTFFARNVTGEVDTKTSQILTSCKVFINDVLYRNFEAQSNATLLETITDTVYTSSGLEYLRIPSQTGNTGLDVNGLALTNPAYKAGVGHNNAESKYLNYPVASLIKEDMLPGGVSDVPMKYLYGEELVANGHFDSDSVWTKQSGWTIVEGKANCDGSSTLIFQEDVIIASDSDVIVRFKIEDYVSGSVKARVEDTSGHEMDGNGIHTDIINSNTTSANCLFGLTSINFIGSICDVSFKKITDITPVEISYRDIDYDKYELDPYHRVFANAEELKKRDMVIYETEQSGEALTKIYKAIKKPE